MKEPEPTFRRVVLAVGLWVLVAGSGSWLVWTVIAAVGGSFVQSDRSLPVGVGTGVVLAPSSSSPSSTPSVGPTSVPVRPATSPAPTPTSSNDAPRTSPPAPEPGDVSRTWTGTPGVVTVRCTGPRIALGGAAVTASGYAVEVKSRGPDVVSVEFHGRVDETVADVRVTAACVGGRPSFSVASDD